MTASSWLFLFLMTSEVSAGDVAPLARAPAELQAATALEDPPGEARRAPDIVVTGRRGILADVPPETELDPQDISGFGAGTIGELLEQLSPQTRGTGSPGAIPLVLINGQRTFGLDEIRNLPPEAVLRIEILPEHVALRYGMRPGRKVVNLVLQPRFRAITSEGTYGAATDGGRSLGQARVNVAGIAPGGRWSLDAAYARESALSEDERSLSGGLGRFRTLLPMTEQLSLGSSFSRQLSGETGITLRAKVERRGAESRIGPVAPDAGSGSDGIKPLLRNSLTRSASFGADIRGVLGSWNWSATGSYGRVHQRIDTERAVAAGPPVPDVARYRTESGDLELLAIGDLADLPAGPLMATFGARLETFDSRSRSSAALIPASTALSRRIAGGQVNLEAPILDGSMKGLEGVGELWANLNFNLQHVSAFGTLATRGAGLRWTPARWVSINLSLGGSEIAPDPQSLSDPLVLLPNFRTFDFTRGETVDVLRVDGGNPDLLAEARRSFDASLSVRPLPARNLLVTASYTHSRVSDPVRVFSTVTPEIEAAFPERFERSPEGRLLRIDARPLNAARAERKELRWGISYFKRLSGPPQRQATESAPGAEPLGAEAARAAGFDLKRIRQAAANPGTLQLSLHHSWVLRDRLLVRPGMEPLDFLKGAVSGLGGGTPEHRIEAQAAAYRSGLGARLTGSWKSPTSVRSQDRSLFYDSTARFDLRLFADLGERPRLVERMPWLRSTRVSLEVDNVLNDRPRARDREGRIPLGLQPAYLDPAGRTVRISLRKLF